jgi:hypothetical protein
MEEIIRSDGYRAFLEYMCPGYSLSGKFPPDGGNSAQCPRQILGVYDDHDFGWNNGNGKQLKNRAAIKQVRLESKLLWRRAAQPSDHCAPVLVFLQFRLILTPCKTRQLTAVRPLLID